MTKEQRREHARALVREALAHAAQLRLSFLLQRFVPLAKLRELARTHEVTVKGFRVDRAPAAKLAQQLADLESGKLETVCEALVAALETSSDPTESGAASDGVSASVHGLVVQAEVEARRKLERSEEQLARLRERVDALQNELRVEREAHIRTQAELRSARSAPGVVPAKSDGSVADARRLHELERDYASLVEAEARLRRTLALRETKMREAEEQVRELEELIPKSRRKKRKPMEPLPEPEVQQRVPFFTDSFYRSLDSKERASVERAFRAVFLYCTEGPAYPGLEVKHIEGQELWSLRASLKLRVYFRPRPDGDIDVLELSDREDQHTALRRWKDR